MNTDLQLKALDALAHIHTAVKNVQLYPDADLTITHGIEMLYLHLLEILRNDSPSVYAELERKSSTGENMTNQQQDNTIHILSLLDILRGMGIKHISFDKAPQTQELHVLIHLFAKASSASSHSIPEDVLSDISLEKITEDIYPEKEVLGEKDKEQIIVPLSGLMEEPVCESVIPPDMEKDQTTVSGMEDQHEPVAESFASIAAEKVPESVAGPGINEEPIPENIVQMEEEKDRVKTLELEIAQTPVSGTLAPLELEKDQSTITGFEFQEEPVAEIIATLDPAKNRIITAGDDMPPKSVPESIDPLTTGKEQVTASADEITEDQLTERIAKIQIIFTRLNAMDGAIESLPSEEKMAMIKKLSEELVQWMETENNVTLSFKKTCLSLQALLQDFIKYGYFTEANPIINIISKINAGTIKKDDKVRETYGNVLRNLGSESNINLLLKEVNLSADNKNNEAFQILVGFGDIGLRTLLNRLQDASESKERISILHIIEEIGNKAIPAIKERITVDASWYYLRNMAYLLGRVGNESSADALRPLVLHKEKRVSKEALKSIGQTGGNKRGPLLVSVLPQVDQELRLSIIDMLGKIKCIEAVTNLREMLKNKASLSKDEFLSVQEKICNALGNIGSSEAIKFLSEIAESKSILGIGSYPKEVKHAAENALAYIKRKQ